MEGKLFSSRLLYVAVMLMFSACNQANHPKDTSSNKDSTALPDTAKKASADSVLRKQQTKAAEPAIKLNDDAARFLVKSYEYGLFQLQLGKLAETNALNFKVTAFAEGLIKTHRKVNEQLINLANSHGLTLIAKVNYGHQSEIDMLAKMKGKEFDRQFMETVTDLQSILTDDYKNAVKITSGTDVKRLAVEVLPLMQAQSDLAQNVRQEIKIKNL